MNNLAPIGITLLLALSAVVIALVRASAQRQLRSLVAEMYASQAERERTLRRFEEILLTVRNERTGTERRLIGVRTRWRPHYDFGAPHGRKVRRHLDLGSTVWQAELTGAKYSRSDSKAHVYAIETARKATRT